VSFASQFQCGFRFNSYIGFAVAAKLHGTAGIAAMGLVAGAMVPLANFAAVGMLARHGGASLWRELAKNPLVLATLAGLLWNLLGLGLPAPLAALLGRLAEAAIALGLLAVGAALRLHGAPGGGHAAAGWFLAVKLLGMPVATIALARGFGLTGLYFDIALAFAALPTASSAYILAQRMGGDGARVAWLISAGTLLGMATLPFWLALLVGSGG
jgi:predicted permease